MNVQHFLFKLNNPYSEACFLLPKTMAYTVQQKIIVQLLNAQIEAFDQVIN